MNTNDDDLEQMFAALRAVDEGLAPPFSETVSQVIRAGPAKSDRRHSLPVRVALTAIACSVVIGLAIWLYSLRIEVPIASSRRHADLQKLNLACDSLLVTYDSLPSEMTNPVEQEMEWPTQTDSLLPFETLAFRVRNSP